MKHYAWTHIEAFKNVNRYVQTYIEGDKPVVTYRGKIKLHGTNAGIQINKDGVFAQSRNRMLTVEDDNVGFAKWVEATDVWQQYQEITNMLATDNKTVIYGEWAGTGIMKGTSVSNIGKRIFAIFAVRYVNDKSDVVLYEPEDIKHCFEQLDLQLPEDVYILPWGTEEVECNFNNQLELQLSAQKFNNYVEKVEDSDPWVKEVFDVDGNGEGYVFYPVPQVQDYERMSHFIFKAKGDKHRKEGAKKKVFVPVSAETLNSIGEFVDMFVTIDRLEQAVREACGGDYNVRQTGNFMKWIGNDIQREGLAELEANNLEWKQVAKEVTNRSRDWWLKKCAEI